MFVERSLGLMSSCQQHIVSLLEQLCQRKLAMCVNGKHTTFTFFFLQPHTQYISISERHSQVSVNPTADCYVAIKFLSKPRPFWNADFKVWVLSLGILKTSTHPTPCVVCYVDFTLHFARLAFGKQLLHQCTDDVKCSIPKVKENDPRKITFTAEL